MVIKLIKILIILFMLFYTETTYNLSNTYQESLFTTENKVDRNNDKFGGYTFKFGGTIEDIQSWDRYRVGYPFGAVTIDKQEESKITQGRIQYDYIIVNIILGFIIILIFNIIIKIFKSIKKVIDNSRIFEGKNH